MAWYTSVSRALNGFTEVKGGNAAVNDVWSADIYNGKPLAGMFIYSDIACVVKVNGTAEELLCPADTARFLPYRITSFVIKAVTPGANGTVYWDGGINASDA